VAVPSSPVTIFCDGACEGNPGPGGYGVIVRDEHGDREFSDGEAATTNNRMELMGALVGLRQVAAPRRIRIVSDSQYLVRGMTEWIHGWVKRNWRKPDRKPVLNRDLWEAILAEAQRHEVQWSWIRGHAGHAENERCDELAREAAARKRPFGRL
jgi:ribonuclease HI